MKHLNLLILFCAIASFIILSSFTNDEKLISDTESKIEIKKCNYYEKENTTSTPRIANSIVFNKYDSCKLCHAVVDPTSGPLMIVND